METNALIPPPSLAHYFAQERQQLRQTLNKDLSPSQVVGEMRRALDRTGLSFTRSVTDPQIQKAGLWLLEIIKSGAGVLDRATHADVTLVETAPKSGLFDGLKDWRPGLFYIAAAGLATVGLVQGIGLVVISAVSLAAFHALSHFKLNMFSRLPFVRKPKALPSPDGKNMTAEASIRTDSAGFINQISDALATADHILARMVQTEPDAHWRDDPALMAVFQNLLEANAASDGNYALQVVGKDMKSVLASAGIEAVDFNKSTKHMFDELPALIINEGDPDLEMAAPALVGQDGRLLRRGTVWVRK
ncbi:hypothetical protein [Litorimonas haliclonae]|uniref:hypothetical protein n=1 Tax=Litorimonas haliclonae TaxID=2081977 RepID=UPI0039EF08BB